MRTRCLAWVVWLVMWAAHAAPAAAFWPFTRGPARSAPADSAAAARVEDRWQTWKSGPKAEASSAGDSLSPAPSGVAAGTTIRTSLAATAAGAEVPPGAPGAGARPTDAPPAGANVAPGSATAPGGVVPPSDPPLPPPGTPPTDGGFGASFGSNPSDEDSLSVAGAGAFGPDSVAAGAMGGSPPGTVPPPGSTPANPAAAAAAAAAQAGALQKGFAPDLSSKLTTTNDFVRMNMDLSTSFADQSGVVLGAQVGYSENIGLNTKTDQQARNLLLNFSVPLRRQGITFGISTVNRRDDKNSRTISNLSTSDALETKGADANVQFSRRLERIPVLRGVDALRGMSVNAFYARRHNQSDQVTRATAGSGNGARTHAGTGNSYGVGAEFDRLRWMKFRARWGTTKISNRDRATGLGLSETESASDGDTATVDVSVPAFWRVQSATLTFRTSNGNDTYTDNARNLDGTQQGSVGNYTLETKNTLSRSLSFTTKFQPLRRFDLGVSVNATRDSLNYQVRRNNFNDTQRLGVRLESKLTVLRGTLVAANFETNTSDVNQDDRGVPNPLTHRDEDRKLYVEVSRKFTTTMSVRIYGESQLAQGFYKYEGPQGFGDRDELRQRAGVEFSGSLSPAVSTRAQAYVRQYNQAFIDPRRSINSRDEKEYVVRGGYSWKLNDQVDISQDFGLASKVVDEIFKVDQNTLNRNHFMNTRLGYRMTNRLALSANYDYLLQDNGRYLTDRTTGEAFYQPTARTKKDGIGVGVRYDIITGGKLTFLSRQEATRQRLSRFNNRPQNIVEQGNLALGFESKLDFRGLKLQCNVQRNESFNVLLNRPVYYNVDALVSYTF